MTTITTRAVYKDGVLKPATKLDLPDGAPVEVQVTALPVAVPGTADGFGSLHGILKLSQTDLGEIEQEIDQIRRESTQRIERLARELDNNPHERHA